MAEEATEDLTYVFRADVYVDVADVPEDNLGELAVRDDVYYTIEQAVRAGLDATEGGVRGWVEVDMEDVFPTHMAKR